MNGGCSEENIITIRNNLTVEKDEPLSATFNLKEPVQLAPQKINLRVRPGLPTTFTVRFKRVDGYPVDLYYLMDLSYSMKDDLQKIKTLGKDLFTALKKITQHGQIGFGAFVDKTVLPYTNTNPEKLRKPCDDIDGECQAAFGYRHVLSLTPSEENFKNKVEEQFISGNLDSPEGSLDAMMQATVCGDKIGWRNSSTRLIVLTTDAGFHMAGDGKLAGILEPNDGQCHLNYNLYSKSSEMDYPSVGQLALKLEKHNIQPIFAVTDNVKDVYRHLSKMIPKSEVGILSSDSGNVVNLIQEAYNKLSSKVTLTHDVLPEDIRVTYKPKCEHPLSEESAGICDNVLVAQEISFDVTVTALSCLKPQTFSISPLGIKDSLTISISADCDCQCSDSSSQAYSHCNNQGQVQCGICKCNEGFLGQFCNCSLADKDERGRRTSCVRGDGPECEGRGDCVCGRCECYAKPSGKYYHGRYCECDDEQCERSFNQLCGGNGACRCGECKCYEDFEGSACECKRSEDSCRTQNGTVCNGRGICKCNNCKCDNGYQPPLCLKCPDCPDPCQTKLSCIECLGFNIGPFKHNCTSACGSVTHHMVEHFTSSKQCEQKDSDGCWVKFRLQQLVGKDKYSAEILRSRDCPPSVTAIIAASVAAVALIGILLLLLIKLLIYMKDLKEFRKFENEKKKSKWAEADNPLFQNATTTVANPTFTGE